MTNLDEPRDPQGRRLGSCARCRSYQGGFCVHSGTKIPPKFAGSGEWKQREITKSKRRPDDGCRFFNVNPALRRNGGYVIY